MRQSLLAGLLFFVLVTAYGGGEPAPRPGEDERHRDPVLMLYDSHGARIGPIVSYGFQDGVMLTLNGAVVFAAVARAQSADGSTGTFPPSVRYSASQLTWLTASGVYFASSDCTGAGYFRVSDAVVNLYAPTRPSIAVRAGQKVTLYIASDTTTSSTAVSSFFATVLNRCLSFPPESIDLWKTESTFDLTDHYPEPLSAHY